jgi:hypothetical protein
MTMPEVEIQRTVLAELAPGEKIKWLGKPDPAQYARQALPMVVFGIPWTLFALFWEGGAIQPALQGIGRAGGPGMAFSIMFPLFGLPFIGIGIGMLTSPIWYRRKAANTIYAVTDRRALIIEDAGRRTVQSFDRSVIAHLTRNERGDGSGNLLFGPDNNLEWAYRRRTSGSRTTPGFYGIRTVRQVEQLLRETLDARPALERDNDGPTAP